MKKRYDEKKSLKYRIETVPSRNDGWINSHFWSLFEVWGANVDFQLVLDVGKVINFMAKYVTKAEDSVTKGAASLIRSVLKKTIDEGLTVQAALKRTMSKLIGERMMGKQETCHLINSIPLVSCSHNFVRINLNNDSSKLDVPDSVLNDQSGSTSATIKTLMDVYSERHQKSVWFDERLYLNYLPHLEHMNLCTFCSFFMVGKKGKGKNKIRAHMKNNFVAVFYPRFSSNPKSPKYEEYCKKALLKYKPWSGAMDSV